MRAARHRRSYAREPGGARGRAAALVSVAVALLAYAGAANAQDDDDRGPSIALSCTYLVAGRFGFESAAIEAHTRPEEIAAATKVFAAGPDVMQLATFAVTPGQLAECVYPSGTVVRLNVGAYAGRGYGMCGGGGEVFASVWVNRRKLVSREWMAGHCKEDSDMPDLSFRMFHTEGASAALSFDKCGSPFDAEEPPTDPAVCVRYPDVERYPLDAIEYPPDGSSVAPVGTIEIASGTDPVCEVMREEWIAADARNGRQDPLAPGLWTLEAAISWGPSAESIFDFDNDGMLDRVLKRTFYHNYMDGQILYVRQGSSTVEPPPATELDESYKQYPCQMGGVSSYLDCPPFSQKNDEASFDVPADPAPVHFRGRYSILAPFRFDGTTYLRAERRSQELEDYQAVLRPRPGGTFTPTCLLHRVTENF